MKKLLIACALMLAAPLALAQTPSISFTATVVSGNGTLDTTLNWSTTPVATSCTASGSPSWTGTKPASGTQVLPTISLSGSYTLTLACSFPGVTNATITWTPPTTNTDNTALAKCASQTPGTPCLLQFKVYRSTNATINMATDESKLVDDRNAVTYNWTGITQAGSNTFAVTALNGLGVESQISNTAVKVITTTSSQNSSVTLTVNPIPGKPTNVTAT